MLTEIFQWIFSKFFLISCSLTVDMLVLLRLTSLFENRIRGAFGVYL